MLRIDAVLLALTFSLFVHVAVVVGAEKMFSVPARLNWHSIEAPILELRNPFPSKPARAPSPANAPVSRATSGAATASFAPLLSEFRPRPRYPDLARERGWEGRVELRVTTGPDGRVMGAILSRSSGYAVLDDSALEAVLRWRIAAVSETAHLLAIDFRLSD